MKVIKNVSPNQKIKKVLEETNLKLQNISIRNGGNVFVSLITGCRIAEYSFFKDELTIF
jgi:hypothetical protein